MDKYIIKWYYAFFLGAWFLIAGCTQFPLNLHNRVKEVNNCTVDVIDSRFDKKIFIDAQTITTIPSLQEILRSKLCQRDIIQGFIKDGTGLVVYISNIRCGKVNHFTYSKLSGSMSGQIQVKRPGEPAFYEYLIVSPIIEMNKAIFSGSNVYKDFIEYVLDAFVTETEKTIGKIKEGAVNENVK